MSSLVDLGVDELEDFLRGCTAAAEGPSKAKPLAASTEGDSRVQAERMDSSDRQRSRRHQSGFDDETAGRTARRSRRRVDDQHARNNGTSSSSSLESSSSDEEEYFGRGREGRRQISHVRTRRRDHRKLDKGVVEAPESRQPSGIKYHPIGAEIYIRDDRHGRRTTGDGVTRGYEAAGKNRSPSSEWRACRGRQRRRHGRRRKSCSTGTFRSTAVLWWLTVNQRVHYRRKSTTRHNR